MLKKSHLLILFLAFCTIYCRNLPHLEDSNSRNESYSPCPSFRNVIGQLKTNISQYQKFDNVSQSLSNSEERLEEFDKNFWEAQSRLQIMKRDLKFTLHKHLLVEPIQNEREIYEKAKVLEKSIANMEVSYMKLKQEVDQIPFKQLIDGFGKVYEELGSEISQLEGDHKECSDQRSRLLGDLESFEKKHNDSLNKIIDLDKKIQSTLDEHQEFDAILNDLERDDIREETKQLFQGKKQSVLESKKKAQLEIDKLIERKEEITIFPSSLEDLRQRCSLKNQECNSKQENISKKLKEKTMLMEDKSLEVSVLTQMRLIGESEKFQETFRNFKDTIDYELNHLKKQKWIIEGSLERLNSEYFRKNTLLSADLLFSQVYNKSSCPEIADCFQEIFIEKFQYKTLDTQLSLSTLLSVIFAGARNISSMLNGEYKTISLDVQELIEAKILIQKESLWSLTSLLQAIIKKVFGSDLFHFVKVGEKELRNEVRNAQVILDLVNRDLKLEYEKFIFDSWEKDLQETMQELSNLSYSESSKSVIVS